ncbi:MAG: cytochrome c3 family protein [Deltaproteobacteria bacterium]|nr:cytochrome c3 family protein [Deltaproteobacteria bacterium]
MTVRNRLPLLPLLLLLLLTTPTGAAEEPLVLFPPDLTLATEGKIKIFAYVPGGKTPLSVSVNGIARDPLKGEAFRSGEAELSPGMNLLDVGGKYLRVFLIPGTKMEQFRMPTEKEDAPLVYRSFRLHPALDDGCAGCHTLEGGKLKAIDQKEACYACHDNFEKEEEGKKKYVHSPVAAGECTGCHDPHFSSRTKLQKLEKGCMECHDPFPTEGVVHYPVGNGECTACHSPHAGPAPKQLVRAGNALCLGCHEHAHIQHRSATVLKNPEITQIPPDIPREKDQLSCLACHRPHQSGERRLFRRNQGELCKTCHLV